MNLWNRIKLLFGGKGRGDQLYPADLDSLLEEFQEKIDYRFSRPDLLSVALTHRSFAKAGGQKRLPSNERLEFLGDSVLGLITADFLFLQYPDKLEGGMTKLKSLLVNETTLFQTAEMISLGKFILLSPEEDRSGGRGRASINADAFEAVIGAIYIDGGLGAVKPFIEKYILSRIEELAADENFRNYKGELLELLQSRSAGMPRYEVASESGPEHSKMFTIVVYSNGRRIGEGVGPSKKDAEQKAASVALIFLEQESTGA